MNAAVRGLLWELLWKNRIALSGLAALWAVGVGLVYALHARPDAWWMDYARNSVGIAFFASVTVAFASFTLVDVQEGWSSRSVVTRWFALPVRTSTLVVAPMLLACGCILLLVVCWSCLLSRTLCGHDPIYQGGVLAAGMALTQLMAWIVPRQSVQFGFLWGVAFWTPIGLAFWPWISSSWTPVPLRFLWLPVASVFITGLLAVWAATRNRCGDWSGEIPIGRFVQLFGWGRTRTHLRRYSRPSIALFWSDTWPVFRNFTLTWLGLGVVIILLCYCIWPVESHFRSMPLRFIVDLSILFLPVLGLVLPAAWSWVLSSGRGTPFQTRLSSFRATHPVTSGVLAGTRINIFVLVWSVVWISVLALYLLNVWDLIGHRIMFNFDPFKGLAWSMAIGANAMIGALPLYLRGRLEGSPLLLASVVGWAWTWLLVSFLSPDWDQASSNNLQYWASRPSWMWIILVMLITFKFAVAAWALIKSWRERYITWRFVLAVAGGWLGITSGLIWILPAGQCRDPWNILGIAVLMPLARLAVCPLAIAANRHR